MAVRSSLKTAACRLTDSVWGPLGLFASILSICSRKDQANAVTSGFSSVFTENLEEGPFDWIQKVLRCLGLLKFVPGWKGNIWTVGNLVCHCSLLLAATLRFLQEGVKFSERIEAALIFIGNFHLATKLIGFSLRRPQMLSLFTRIQLIIEKSLKEEEFRKLLRRNIFLTKLGFLVIAGNFTLMHLIANVSSIVKHMHNIHALPFQFYVPFDEEKYFYWACLYTYLISFLPVLNLAGAMSLVVCLVLECSGAMEYLRTRLTRLGSLPQDGHSEDAELREVIALHQEVISIVSDLNNFLSDLLYIEFLVSSLQICIAGYQLMIGRREGDPRTPVYFFVFFLTLLVPVFFCFCGNEIKLKGERLLAAAYDNSWYSLKPQNQKRLLLLLAEGGRGLDLSYRGLVTFDMVLYSQIVKTSYSLVAMLQTMENVSTI